MEDKHNASKKCLHHLWDPAKPGLQDHRNSDIVGKGRDPNSYSGVFWILGRYDRAWGPERSIFGKIRYMTSDSTARKFNLKPYLEKWGNESLGVSTSISK